MSVKLPDIPAGGGRSKTYDTLIPMRQVRKRHTADSLAAFAQEMDEMSNRLLTKGSGSDDPGDASPRRPGPFDGTDPISDPDPVRRIDRFDFHNRVIGATEREGRTAFEEERRRFEESTDSRRPGDSGLDDFVPGFTDRVRRRLDAKRDAFLKGAPDETSKQDLVDSYKRVADRVTRQAAAYEQARKVKARADHAEQALGAFAASARANPEELDALGEDGDRVLNRMVASGVDPGAVAERRRQFRDQLGQAALAGLADRDPDDAAGRIRSGAYDGWFKDGADKDAILKRLGQTKLAQDQDTAVRLAARQQEEARAQHRARLTFDASVREKLKTKTLSHEDITKALWEGTIDDAEAEHYAARLTEAVKAQESKANQIITFQDALKQGTPLDAQDPDIRDALEAHVEAVLGEGADGQGPQQDPAERIRLEDHLVRQIGYLPQQVLNPIRGGIIAGTPEEQAAAAKRLDTLLKDNPRLKDILPAILPEAERTRAAAIADLLGMGIKPQKAVEITTARLGDPVEGLVLGANEPGSLQEPTELGQAEPSLGPGEPSNATDTITQNHDLDDLPELDPDQADALADYLDDFDLDSDGASIEDVPDQLVKEVGELVLSVLPGTGEVISAKEAYHAFIAARAALDDEDLGEALLKGGEGAIAALGAIPFLGTTVRFGKAGAKAASILFKAFKASKKQGRRATETIARTGRSASKAWFGKWADDLLKTGRTHGKIARVGTLSPKVQSFLKSKGITPSTVKVSVIDKRLLHIVRSGKNPAQKLPEDLVRSIPTIMKNPKAVLWDKKDPALLYVFDVPGDTRKGKFIVRVDIDPKINRGDKSIRQSGNYISSGGKVPIRNLKGTKSYDLIEGSL